MDAFSFKQELTQLQRGFKFPVENVGSHRCIDCRQCTACMFCERCTDCFKCTYCHDCQTCTETNHSARCQACHRSAYCLDCKQCTGSVYLTLCSFCTECTYCFGCVGLIRQEFHILNRRYSRDEYFALTKRLFAELKLGATP